MLRYEGGGTFDPQELLREVKWPARHKPLRRLKYERDK